MALEQQSIEGGPGGFCGLRFAGKRGFRLEEEIEDVTGWPGSTEKVGASRAIGDNHGAASLLSAFSPPFPGKIGGNASDRAALAAAERLRAVMVHFLNDQRSF